MTDDGRQMNALQDLVLTRMAHLGGDEPLSLRDVSGRSHNLISFETVRSIVRGTHSGRIGDRTAEGLARALEVPVATIYEAAGVQQPSGPWSWPERFNRLDAAQRRLVEDMAAGLLDAYDKGRRSSRD